MTKQLILPLAAIILLSSCAGKFGLQKRRYTKGYYVSATKKNHAPAKHETKHEILKQVEDDNFTKHVTVKNTSVKPETVVNEPVKNQETIVVKPVTATPVVVPQTQQITASTSNKETTHTKAQFKAIDLKTKIAHAKKGGDADVNTIVLVILCIFIPPLAVFLFDKKLGLNFWIDLLLTLCFYLPGIIFAFLVCFAGVSL